MENNSQPVNNTVAQRTKFKSLDELQNFVCDVGNYKQYYTVAYPMTANLNILSRNINRVRVVNYFMRYESDSTCLSTYEQKETPIVLVGHYKGQECTAVNFDTLCSWCTLINGNAITIDDLMQSKLLNKNSYQLPVHLKASVPFYAICVPLKYKCALKVGEKILRVNLKGTDGARSRGDFIVCPSINGVPDLQHVFVMRGDLFITLFCNQTNGEWREDSWERLAAPRRKPTDGVAVNRSIGLSHKNVFFNLYNAVVGLFTPIITERNMNGLLQQICKLSVGDEYRLLMSLKDLVARAGSVLNVHKALGVWKRWREAFVTELCKKVEHAGLCFYLKSSNMFGNLELTTDESGNVVLGFVYYLLDDTASKCRYGFKCVDVFTTMPMLGEAGSFTEIIPMTTDASLLLENLDYPGFRNTYNLCFTQTLNLLQQQNWVISKEESWGVSESLFINALEAWGGLLRAVPVSTPEFLKNKGYSDLLGCIVNVPEVLKNKMSPTEIQAVRGALLQRKSTPPNKKQKQLNKVRRQVLYSADKTKANSNTTQTQKPIYRYERFINLMKQTVTDRTYNLERVDIMLNKNTRFVKTILELINKNATSLWRVGVKPVLTSVKADDMFNSDFVIKCEDSWYFVLYSCAKSDMRWTSKVALMIYNEATGKLTGRKRTLDFDDRPWFYTWMELGNMAYGEKSVEVEMSVSELRQFLL